MTVRYNFPVREIVPETDVDARRFQLNEVGNQIYTALVAAYPDIDETTLPDGSAPAKDRWEANEVWNKISRLTDNAGDLYITVTPDLIGADAVVTTIFDAAALAWSNFSAGSLTIGGGWNTLPPEAEYPAAPERNLPDLRFPLPDPNFDPPPPPDDAA
jgi:hypothetical protein